MSYNFLRIARSIKNSLLCRRDTLNGYISDISINGDFDGWTVFNDVYLYGSWNGTLFGNSLERSCYINRGTNFATPVVAETYYIIKLMMKITDNNTQKVVSTLTTGRIRWTTLNDNTWDSTKQVDFTITPDNKWRLYQINMGPSKNWQGDITNLRIFPFVDGFEKDHFAIKFIKISSPSTFVCTNTSCSFFPFYSHPCPGAGIRASREAGVSRDYYTTTVGNDALTVNINGYGNETFELGDNSNLSGPEMARTITNALGGLNIGSYIFAEAEYSVNDKIKITSGSPGSAGSVVIPYSAAAEALGFYDSSQADISTVVAGFDQATGFDYAASRLFKPFEINKLIDGDQVNFAYIHNPAQLSVEGGRRDFSEVGNSRLISDLRGNEHYESLNNKGRTIIDVSHPINNNGRIKRIYIFGKIDDDTQAKIKICRPKRDGTFTVVNSLTFDSKLTDVLYTSRPLTYRIDTDILVDKGDLIGIYNANLYVGVSITGLPDASFYQFNGEVSGNFDPGKLFSFGVAGLAVYARGDRLQTNAILDIDLGDRINIEQVDIYGKEEAQHFEFNLASCLDVDWSVNLYGNSHIHSGVNWLNGIGFVDTHTNIAYGEEALDDMITTPDNGQVGDSVTNTGDGLATTGSTHSYFYVNGDAEWLYTFDASDPAEYHWPRVPELTAGFVNDPISFTLLFPNETLTTIHKSIMYFKEDDNFRNLELAYYLGTQNATGNATVDRNFKRISSYTSIRLDGALYDSTNKELVEGYIFKNPMSDEPIFGAGGIQNSDKVKIAHRTYWNIIEHNFSDIECRGFRIYTNKHNSTKILELEVYSRVATDPALVDNITMSFSDYNEVFKDVEFEEIEEGHVSGFIGGSPRYFTIEMEATNEFSINEIDMSVGDQLKLTDCSDTVLLDHSRRDVTNKSKAITLENIYDRPFDLVIDLPRETDENDGLIFWSKLESDDDIENPDVGPTCFLHKEDNYDILNDNSQCAINIPAYGLKNLIHGKEAYYSYNDLDYVSLGTLVSGTSLDFCNTLYKNARQTELSFTAVSSQYWKVGIGSASFSVLIKDIIVYFDGTRAPISTVYSGSTLGSSSQTNSTVSDGSHMDGINNQPILDTNVAFGFDIGSTDPIDKIRLIHDSSVISSVNIYVSPDNANNYVQVTSSGSTVSLDTVNGAGLFTRFAIDLEKRHVLDIIRNYGVATDKLLISTSVATDFSNSLVSNVDSVTWGNSTSDDARWVRIIMPNDTTTSCIRKLGIYPNIEQNTAIGGGYNCEWEALSNILSDYEVPINVAFGATVTGTNNFFSDWFPDNAVDGVSTKFFAADSWGFQKVGATDPYLEIDFGQTHTINKVKLFHSHDPGSEDYMNTDYNISVSTTTSGSFTQVVSVTGNDDFEIEHTFDPVSARRLRFTVTGYGFETLTITNLDGEVEVFKGSFLREIEVYTYVSAGSVDSESWPIVCMYLKSLFMITNHDLINKDNAPTNSDWDNDEAFFDYSGNILDDPQKVSFTRSGQYVVVYFSLDTSGSAPNYYQGNVEFVFDRNVFLAEGTYRVTWDAYDASTDEEISLRFEGPQTVDFFATELGAATWTTQDDTIQIPENGFYDVKGIQHIAHTNIWGVRNPLVQKVQGETTWVAVTRDTATNYSYDDDSNKYGIDYLDKIKIYGDKKFRPTEYSWWWDSTASTLSNDALNVKVGTRSLQIDYTSSSGTDTLAFIEGDDFGQDEFWSPKDILQFWLKIDDVSKLDTAFGDITFGDINRGNPYYYTWDISNLSLSSGWNLIKLKFDDYASTFPAANSFAINQFLDGDLDFRNNNKDMASFRMRYRGLGESFTMYLDNIHIERNRFEDDVKFGKGLCLTGAELLEIPAAGLTLEKGAVEFWLKPYYDSYGRDAFGNLSSKTFFTLTNNNNDLISLGLKAGNWFEVVNGNIRSDLNKFDTENANLIGDNFMRRDEVTHLAIVWSNDSEFFDNNNTIRLYLNGLLTYASNVGWTVNDTKSVNIKFGGGNTQLAYNREAEGSGVFDNVKLYSYAKTDFNINDESNTKDVTFTANQFLEISENNSTFYGVGSDQLPLIFQQVPVGTIKTIYIRSNKNDNFLQSKLTASLIVQWLTTV